MKYLIISLLLITTQICNAQSFFKPLPKPSRIYTLKFGLALAPDSVINTFRPVANLASYGLSDGNGILLSGAGVSYQHLKWDATAQKWNAIYSINALAWYAAPLSSGQSTAFAYGATVGFLNNLILVGAAYNGSKFFPTIGIGVSLNN